MKDIIVIDDFISRDYQNHILSIVNNATFPWYFRKNIVAYEYGKQPLNIHGFTHELYEEQRPISNFFNTIYPLVLSITEKTGVSFNFLDRMRFNFVLGNPDSTMDYHMPHVDNYSKHYVALYYVNDCDGDTVIFNERLDIPTIERDEFFLRRNEWTIKQRVAPKKGRLLLFPGNYYHSSSYTKTQPYRCVINMNLSSL